MKQIKKFLVEFKSIFNTEDVLKENEGHANIVVATTMMNIFLVLILVWALNNVFHVLDFDGHLVNGVLVRSFIGLFIPATFCFVYKGNEGWIKYLLITFLVVMLAIIDSLLTYSATLLMVIPLVLSARYYSKKFTIFVSALTTILFIISTCASFKVGIIDLNYVNVPKGTEITTSLYETVENIDINNKEYITELLLRSFLPEYVLYIIVAFACIQISQSGKRMIEKQDEISKKGARIESELELAKNIQKNMLPSIFPPFPEHEEIDIYASMIPAKEVGGDFYDMFLIDDEHLAIVMSDVSGKGVPAALFMMISKTLIKTFANNEKDVDDVFNKVNNTLCEGNKVGLFVTSWFGILNLKTGKIRFVNAGHNPPLIYSKKDNEFNYLKIKPNFVLAGMEDTKYRINKTKLHPGDKIFLYTDGVVESTNRENKMYGEERLKKYLDKNINTNVKDTIIGLYDDIDNFVGSAPQFDDITMLELYYKGKKGKK